MVKKQDNSLERDNRNSNHESSSLMLKHLEYKRAQLIAEIEDMTIKLKECRNTFFTTNII
ncbi:MAG: hypothetical protein FWC73_06540 [Defluviitaleaceae bacterium]|nr:hypothetical protein [Defluviitaleaceae bacterium]